MPARYRISRFALLAALSLAMVIVPRGTRAGIATSTWHMYGSPGTVSRFAMVDPLRRRMLMLADEGSTSGLTVWSASLDSSSAWSPLETSGRPPMLKSIYVIGPLPLYGAVLDVRRDRLVVWGGKSTTQGGLSGTYALALGTLEWSRLSEYGPTTLGGSPAYDPVGDRVLVFGGDNSSGLGSPAALNGVRVLDLSGSGEWSGLDVSGTLPRGREEAAIAFDSRRNRVLIFGGLLPDLSVYPSGWVSTDETWELTLGARPAWRLLTPLAGRPSPRNDCFAAYDSLADRMIVLSGRIGSGASYTTELWSLDAANPDSARWSFVSNPWPLRAPPTHALVFDPVRRELVAGGEEVLDTPEPARYRAGGRSRLPIDDPYVWSLATTELIMPANGGPGTFDAARGRVVTVGPSRLHQATQAIWRAALEQPLVWTGSSSFDLRDGGSVVADSSRDRLVQFGGLRAGVLHNSVSIVPFAEGNSVYFPVAGDAPAPRQGHAAAYDPVGDRMLVFGGKGAGTSPPYFNDVWALSFTEPPVWSRLDSLPGRPSARTGAQAVFDGSGHRLLVIGGVNPLTHDSIDELWAFDVDTGAWSQPLPGWGHGVLLAHDPGRRRIYAVGDAANVLDGVDVWRLSLDGTPNWSPVATVGFEPWQAVLALSYDPVHNRLVATQGLATDDRNRAQTWVLQLADDPVPVEVSLVTSLVDDAGIHLVWSLTTRPGPVTVERRSPPGPWLALAQVAPDAGDQVRYDDATVEPGRAYTYALRHPADGDTTRSGLVTVAVPIRVTVAGLVAIPNPTPSAPRFVVYLPAAERAARLEVFDLSGRRVFSRPVGADAPVTVVDLASTPAFRPGVYHARLVNGSRVLASARVAVLN